MQVDSAEDSHAEDSRAVDSRAGRTGSCSENVESDDHGAGQRHHQAHLNAALRSLALDVQYHRASGDSVYYLDESGTEVEVLDMVNGFGALLLGHGHPDLTAAAIRFLNSGAGNLLQGSVNPLATRLAAELSRRTQIDASVVFASSGSEAVEAAMKHALLETGGKVFLALNGSFHGKTLGALQLTSSEVFRSPFVVNGLNVRWLDPTNETDLRQAFANTSRLAGLFFEVIQGEGGIRPVNQRYLKIAAELCREHGIPFISDECHTGLGRTGSFLASHELGLTPDYVVLSKALGGGLAKISALLIQRERYRPEFDVLHSSTFAADGYSCAIALKTLELLDVATFEKCRRTGAMLKDRLRELQQKYPSAVADVRGEGLMLGLELRQPNDDAPFMLRLLKANRLLGLCVAGYLLKSHRIRVAPTLSDPWTLRIQPSAFISAASLDRFVESLDDVLQKLEKRDVVGMTSFLSRGTAGPGSFSSAWPTTKQSLTFSPSGRLDKNMPTSERRVAWLFHLVDGDDLPHLEPALEGIGRQGRKKFLDRLEPLLGPVVMDPVSIRSAAGEPVQLCPILLPITSQRLKYHFDRRRFRKLRALIQRAVDVAAELQCDVVSLGQFTSIVTGQGRYVCHRGMGITSGNSLSVAMAIREVREALVARRIDAADGTLAIVGAAGDIGRACAEILVPEFHSAVLIGSSRPGSADRLRRVAKTCNADISCDLAAAQAAHVVVAATSCVDFPLDASQLRSDAVVCDISIPQTLLPTSIDGRPDITFLRSGLVSLPGSEELGIPGISLRQGVVYGCLAEGLALGWEGRRDRSFTGRVSVEKVKTIGAIAQRHGLEPVACDELNGIQSCERVDNVPAI